MEKKSSILPSQRIIQVSLFLLATISLIGGAIQMYLGEPDVSPRLDNIHRFMAGIYFSMGPLAIWTAITIRKHDTLIFLLSFSVFMAGFGRLISMSIVGIPGPIFWAYLIPELGIPIVMITAQIFTNKNKVIFYSA